jgi:hypothetical protein
VRRRRAQADVCKLIVCSSCRAVFQALGESFDGVYGTHHHACELCVSGIRKQEDGMTRTAIAIVFAAGLVAGASGIAQAAPISPLPPGAANDAAAGNITQAWCGWRCRHGGWGYRRYYGFAPGWCRWHPYRCG